MAAIATQSVEQVDKVPLKVFMDKEKNKVLWAEAGKDFVDILFSFLTMPLGTILRLVAKESNMQPVRVGSLSSLYQSVADFKEEHLWTQTCKEMLLQPRNSMETYCQKLKLNIDDTPMRYFFCESGSLVCSTKRKESGRHLATFRNKKCYCGQVMNKLVSPERLSLGNGFVKETSSFIICDDLNVIPSAFGTSLHLLQKFGVDNIDAIEEQTVDISKKEVLDLLKMSLFSKTPLTDLISKKKPFPYYLNPRNQSEFEIRMVPPSDEARRKMSVKVTVRKSTGEILFAEGEEDFADFLFSFLTFPLGGVLHMLQGFSSLSCVDNLYKSLTELSPERFLLSHDLKDKLTKPRCFPKFELRNQILPIGAASNPEITHLPFNLVDPKLSISKSSSFGEFAKGPSLYMVTDNLVVTPMSSAFAFSYLNRSKVPLSDLEERVISIGLKEGLCLLKASLISTSALTNGLKRFIRTVKEEK